MQKKLRDVFLGRVGFQSRISLQCLTNTATGQDWPQNWARLSNATCGVVPRRCSYLVCRNTDRRFRQHSLVVYFASCHYTYSRFFLFPNFRLNVFFYFPLNYFFIPTFSSPYIYSQFLFFSFVYLFSLLFVCVPFSISFSLNFSSESLFLLLCSVFVLSFPHTEGRKCLSFYVPTNIYCFLTLSVYYVIYLPFTTLFPPLFMCICTPSLLFACILNTPTLWLTPADA